MIWQYNPYTVPVLVGGVITFALAGLAWRHRSMPGATPFALSMLLSTLYAFGYAINTAGADVPTKALGTDFILPSIAFIPLAMLAIALEYVGRTRWLTRRRLLALALVPALTSILTWTNSLHHLIIQRFVIDPANPFSTLRGDFGPWFYLHSVYSYALFMITFHLFVRTLRSASALQRRQTSLMLGGSTLMFAASVWNLLASLNFFNAVILPTPIFFVPTGAVLAWALFRYHLFDLVPVARSAVIESMQDGMIVLDGQDRMVDLNPAAQKIIKQPAAGAMGRPIDHVLQPNPIGLTEITLGAGSEQRCYSLRASPIINDPWPAGKVLLLHDITRQRQLELTARASEAKYRSVVERANEGIAIIQDGLICYANPQLAEIIGYPVDQVIGRPLDGFFSPEYRALIGERYRQRMNGEPVPARYEAVALHRQGCPVDVEIDAGLMDFESRPADLVLIRNITERKYVEAVLHESKQRYQALFENASDAIGIHDLAGHFLEANHVLCERLGYSHAELLNLSVAEIEQPQFAALIPARLEELRRNGSAMFETAHVCRDGRSIPIETNNRIIDYNGAPAVLSIGRDITERKKNEAALQQRTLELQARNEELDAFAHTVAHDLKNPVHLVAGYAQVLLDDFAVLTPEEILEAMHSITRAALKMDNIIDELMLLAGARRQEVEMARLDALDMAGLVVNAQQRVVAEVNRSRAEISVPEAFTWPAVMGYGPWIEEVWVNYLSNAIKYGGQPPAVELGATELPEGRVRFWVHDNGAGTTPAQQTLLFAPFERLGQVRATGHGLGLSIVRRIIEKLGGEVGVESAAGQGSTFYFILLLAPQGPL